MQSSQTILFFGSIIRLDAKEQFFNKKRTYSVMYFVVLCMCDVLAVYVELFTGGVLCIYSLEHLQCNCTLYSTWCNITELVRLVRCTVLLKICTVLCIRCTVLCTWCTVLCIRWTVLSIRLLKNSRAPLLVNPCL